MTINNISIMAAVNEQNMNQQQGLNDNEGSAMLVV